MMDFATFVELEFDNLFCCLIVVFYMITPAVSGHNPADLVKMIRHNAKGKFRNPYAKVLVSFSHSCGEYLCR